MTSYQPGVTPPELSEPSADRKDVLGISDLSAAVFAHTGSGVEHHLQQLRSLGFEICQGGPRHWVVTPSGTPTLIHLYGATELALFVEKRAQQYATLYAARHTS